VQFQERILQPVNEAPINKQLPFVFNIKRLRHDNLPGRQAGLHPAESYQSGGGPQPKHSKQPEGVNQITEKKRKTFDLA
jgi:hypothetical protein